MEKGVEGKDAVLWRVRVSKEEKYERIWIGRSIRVVKARLAVGAIIPHADFIRRL